MNEKKIFHQSQKTYDPPLLAEQSSVKPNKPGFFIYQLFFLNINTHF